ncbi:AraC family transcriptional regulator [Hydrobacter penzbergensis]|uniref:AraC family transcriptional regulator n=1 Tax=Hydrobacter penzbergensis TaxID=1235997 RepID=UPI00214B30AB|nr:AraC family transcriptional regulator [Hydrobacter penzbergensis]
MPEEYVHRTNTVVNFILSHLSADLRLKKLAAIANYSPFHFQKVFKQVTGETPKQYIIRMRLENSAHFIVNQDYKTVTEIALSSGFASPSTFARAFKSYFGICAEELRKLTPKEKIKFRRSMGTKSTNVHLFSQGYSPDYWRRNLEVRVSKLQTVRAVFVNLPLSQPKKIERGFRKVIQLVEDFNLINEGSKFIGVINPHAELYQAGITFQSGQSLPKNVDIAELEGGRFAITKVKGPSLTTFHSLHAIHQFWLPKNNYRIKHSYVFEILEHNPLDEAYHRIEREIFIPIEVVPSI